MSLDAVRTRVDYNNGNGSYEPLIKTTAVFEKWRDFPISKFSHHGAACCEAAREWLFSMDFSNLNGGSPMTGPRWIRQRFEWGPTQWQIHWCQAIDKKALDCGAQAALASEVFKIRGIRNYPCQLVQRYSREATDQWSSKWTGAETSVFWIDDDLIYHEGCAVVAEGNEIKIWDASAGWWINPKQFGGYGSLAAVRLFAPPDTTTSFNWGNHRIVANEWQKLEDFV